MDNIPGAIDNKEKSSLLRESVTTSNGHITGVYPIGGAVATFPLQTVLWKVYEISVGEIDVSDPEFPRVRLFIDKISASILSAATLAIFYIIALTIVSQSTALLGTIVYGIGTNHWNINAQILW